MPQREHRERVRRVGNPLHPLCDQSFLVVEVRKAQQDEQFCRHLQGQVVHLDAEVLWFFLEGEETPAGDSLTHPGHLA